MMALSNELLKPISRIEGVDAAAVYLESGEIILFEKNAPFSASAEEMGAFATDILKASIRGTSALNIGVPDSYRIETVHKVFIHKCIVEGKIGLGVIVDKSANIGLVLLSMEKVIDIVKKEII